MALDVLLNPRDTRGFIKLGRNHRYEVVPESIKFSGQLTEYGCMNCTFLLRMNPLYAHYDLEQYTPIVIKDGPTEVWSGRIISTPSEYGETGIINVECQGWGQHLKDDCTDKEWAISDLGRWVDMRSVPGATLRRDRLLAAGQVQVGEREIYLGIPHATVCDQFSMAGVVLDLGPNPANWMTSAGFAGLTYTCTSFAYSGNTTQTNIKCLSGNHIDIFSASVLHVHANQFISDTTGPYNPYGVGHASTPLRYLYIYIQTNTGPITLSGDMWAKVSAAQSWADNSDQSGGVSTLKASTIISETIDTVAPLISTDRSRIAATSFSIPAFPGDNGKFKYGNELIDKANAFHGNKFLLSPQANPVPIFEALDSSPMFVVGESDDYQFSDPSRNDGRAIYNKIIAEFEDAAGQTSYATVSDENYYTSNDYQFSNPGFETTFTGWSSVVGTVVRSTTTGHNGSVASARFTSDGSGGATMANTGGAQVVGKNAKHAIGFYMRREVTLTTAILRITNGTTNAVLAEYNFLSVINAASVGAWTEIPKIGFVGPSHGLISVVVILGSASASTIIAYADNFTIYDAINSLISKRRFTRTALRPIGFRTTSAAATQIATLEYNNSQQPPLKGKLEIGGRIRRKEGNSIPVSHIPGICQGRIVFLEQLRNPVTGSFGRMATIMSAEYDESTDKVTIDLDDDRNFISNLKARIL